ncbi:MAG: glycoside hydrolase family 127 protein, partial [Verrucomicrobia bacterium]|nr:glycoside hydrolase family 127 protein [Verrucomicrobiota bacterium]
DASPAKDGYVHLERKWQAGDVVELDLPMPVQQVYAHEKVQADKGKVALMRGPIIYCLEAADQPEVNLSHLVLPPKPEFQAEHCRELLGGLTVLKGKGLADGQRAITVTAIPYYAWANREEGAMMVWSDEAPASK